MTPQKSEFSTLRGDLDTRPGHYYVVSYRQGEQPGQRYHRLAGPWPTHKQADDQVWAVQQFAERHGGAEAHWQHYITARVEMVEGEPAPMSRLGSDPRKWGEYWDLTEAEIAVLAAHSTGKAAKVRDLYEAEPALRDVIARAAESAKTVGDVCRLFIAGLASRDYTYKTGRLTQKGRDALAVWRP